MPAASAHSQIEAFFISPEGRYIPVPKLHIDAICELPESFGFTEEFLRAKFLEHGEAWASESHAREEIILSLLQSGWVRVRIRHERARGLLCMFQVHRVTPEIAALIVRFAKEIQEGIFGTRADGTLTVSLKDSADTELTDGWLTLAALPGKIGSMISTIR